MTQKTLTVSYTAVENFIYLFGLFILFYLNVANKYSTKEDVGFKETEDYIHLTHMKRQCSREPPCICPEKRVILLRPSIDNLLTKLHGVEGPH
jgi:hypothetical protein